MVKLIQNKNNEKKTPLVKYLGVLSSGFREFSNSSTQSEQKWLILDGPIEAYWSDNLNTALDNSRILCLSSGEMIKVL